MTRDDATSRGSTLSSPFSLGSIELHNRVVMAPMTRSRAAGGGVPGPLAPVYYGQRASAGLIVTEGSPVSPQAVGYPDTPGIYTDAQVEGWRQVTDEVHRRGGHLYLQLWHVGRISHPLHQPEGALPVAPSAIRPPGESRTPHGPRRFVTPRALETDELPGVVEQFRLATVRALDAGFDGVEIHGANGYLLDQFLRDGSNRRRDHYGGGVEGRARLLLETTEAVASVAGAERVGVRISPANTANGMTDSRPEETFLYVAEQLGLRSIGYLHVVERDLRGASAEVADSAALRQAFGGAYVVNGGYDLGRAAAVLSAGGADLVAFGKPFISNPDLPRRLELGAPLAAADPKTFYGGGVEGYTDYSALDGPE